MKEDMLVIVKDFVKSGLTCVESEIPVLNTVLYSELNVGDDYINPQVPNLIQRKKAIRGVNFSKLIMYLNDEGDALRCL
jgi:hypothetical protein